MTSSPGARAVVDTRIAYDRRISDLARRVYLALCGAGAWHRAIAVRTCDLASALAVSRAAIRAALKQLADWGYIQRTVRPGAREQLVRADGQRSPAT